MNADQPPSQENYRDEYKIISEEHRFFGSVRFITAAFAMSIQSALFTIFNQTVKSNTFVGVAIALMAIVLLGAVAIIERRTITLARIITKRGVELEFYLGLPNGIFHRFDQLPEEKVVTYTWGINLIYIIMLVLWAVFLISTLK